MGGHESGCSRACASPRLRAGSRPRCTRGSAGRSLPAPDAAVNSLLPQPTQRRARLWASCPSGATSVQRSTAPLPMRGCSEQCNTEAVCRWVSSRGSYAFFNSRCKRSRPRVLAACPRGHGRDRALPRSGWYVVRRQEGTLRLAASQRCPRRTSASAGGVRA